MIYIRRLFFILALIFLFLGCDKPPKTDHQQLVTTALDLVARSQYAEAVPHLQSFVDLTETDLSNLEKSPVRLASFRSNSQTSDLQRVEIYHLLAFCYQQIGESAQAMRSYPLAIGSENMLGDYAVFRLANLCQKAEDLEQAKKWYLQLIYDYPTFPQISAVKFSLANLYLQQQDFASLFPLLKDLRQVGAYRRRAHLVEAKALVQQEKWMSAYQICEQLIADNTTDGTAWNALALLKKIQKSSSEIDISPQQLMNHGLVYYNNRSYSRCRSIFQSIIKKSTGQNKKLAGGAAYQIGYSYFRQRKYSNAIYWFRQVINKYPSSGYLTRAYYRLTVCYRRKGYATRARINLEAFTKKYTWSQLMDDALYDLGRIYERQKHYQLAMDVYRQLVTNHSQSRLAQRTYWQLGWMQFRLGQYDKCLKAFRIIQRKYPRDIYAVVAHYWTAKCYQHQGKDDLATTTFRQVAKRQQWFYSGLANQQLESEDNPRLTTYSDSSIWSTLGQQKTPRVERLMKMGMFKDAIIELESMLNLPLAFSDSSAIDLRTNKLDQTYNLLLCHQKAGNYQQAFRYADKLQQFSQIRSDLGQLPVELYRILYPFYYAETIVKHATKYAIDPLFVAAMIREESRYNTTIISSAGARGLMQIMIPTAKQIAKQLNLPTFNNDMLFTPEINIQLGTWYMSDLMRQFGNNHALVAGAYNGGPSRIKKWLENVKPTPATTSANTSIPFLDVAVDEFIENIPIDETRRHIKKVMDSYYAYRQLYGETISEMQSIAELQLNLKADYTQ